MIHPLSFWMSGTRLMIIVVLLASMMGTARVGAAVALGPVITNAADEKQQQVMVDYEAQQSYREKLKVGLERYNQKQAQRAGILAGMAAQLHAQQKIVVFPSGPATGNEAVKSVKWYLPPLFLILFAVILFGAGFLLKYRRYQHTKTPSV
jgi:hypothetical protein